MKKRIAALLMLLVMLLGGIECAQASGACSACNSSGKVDCGNCSGGWNTRGTSRTGFVRSSCGYCYGRGKVKCTACRGDGRVDSGDPGDTGGSSGSHKADLSATKLTLVAGRSETLKVLWGSGTVKWSSSNKKVATVSSKGKVKAVKAGKCTITAKVGSQKLKCKVTVNKKVYAKSIKLNKAKATLVPGQALQLSYTLSPKTSKITEAWEVSWSSSDSGIVMIDDDLKVKAKKAGTATITVKLKIKKGKTKKVKCKITVEKGLTRFRNWFNKNCYSRDGLKVVDVSNVGTITHDPSGGTWTFSRYDDSSSMCTEECSLTFNEKFTGSARAYYNRAAKPPFSVNIEGSAKVPVNDLSREVICDWKYEEDKGHDTYKQADKGIHALLSGFYVTLRDSAGLKGKGGWRDLGLKGY